MKVFLFQADRDLVLAAVRKSGLALWCAATEMRADREALLDWVVYKQFPENFRVVRFRGVFKVSPNNRPSFRRIISKGSFLTWSQHCSSSSELKRAVLLIFGNWK